MAKDDIPDGQSYSIQPRYNRCGKCEDCRNGGPGHGPYFYAWWRERIVTKEDGTKTGGRMQKTYLGTTNPFSHDTPEGGEDTS